MNYRLKTMEKMDACVFSSDMLYNDEERKHFKAMVERWARALNETENVAPPQQPEQEPVAWMHTTATGDVYFRKKPHDKVFNPQPVYTAPPQREWQGLTDEERNEIINFIWMPLNKLEADVSMTISRAIEAKLKEKNDS